MLEKPRILAVVGPTAGGKSALAEALALQLDGEIVSCDSMQIYRGMDIGTAKPDAATRERIPYHLIDIVEPETDFSAGDYAAAAEAAVADILNRGKLPIFCGGTGLYLDAFLRGVPESPGEDAALRQALAEQAEREGSEALHRWLSELDSESAAAIHPANVRRVIRALEVVLLTGVPKSEWDRRTRELPPRYAATALYLTFEKRELLYHRIEERVDAMLEMGLLTEARRLLEAGVFERSKTAAGAIGYKELLPYLRGETTLEEAVLQLKTATRRYAKRQITWFSAKSYVTSLMMDANGRMRNFEEIVNNAQEIIANSALCDII